MAGLVSDTRAAGARCQSPRRTDRQSLKHLAGQAGSIATDTRNPPMQCGQKCPSLEPRQTGCHQRRQQQQQQAEAESLGSVSVGAVEMGGRIGGQRLPGWSEQ